MAICGLRMLSMELLRDLLAGLFAVSAPFAASFFCCFRNSISSLPLSNVNDLKASNRFFDFKIAWTKVLLPSP